MGFFSIRSRFQNQPVAFKRPRHCRSLTVNKRFGRVSPLLGERSIRVVIAGWCALTFAIFWRSVFEFIRAIPGCVEWFGQQFFG